MASVTPYSNNQSTGLPNYDNDIYVQEFINSKVYISSHLHSIICTAIYLALVLKVLPRFMLTRRPYNLSLVIAIYNFTQILYNAVLCLMFINMMKNKALKLWDNTCNPVTAANNFDSSINIKLIKFVYAFYINKLYDLTDTIFFCLKKKTTQMTFLHVYHHASVLPCTWLTAFYFREELGLHLMALNSLVHFIMYIYYFLANLGPSVQKYLWWKRYITAMQIIQFIIILSIFAKSKIENCKCDSLFILMWTLEVGFLLFLFGKFYFNSYRKKQM